MIEKNFVVGPLQCNCRLLACPETGQAILIDPGDEAKRLVKELEGLKTNLGKSIQVRYLLHTHGHFDHIGATRGVREALFRNSESITPKIAIHRDDEPLYLNLKMQGQLLGLNCESPLPVDHYLEDGEELSVGELKFSMIHTPGHSPGSVCIRLHENSKIGVQEALFSGDTLFRHSVGRTDLWGGDQDLLFKSIRQRILVLDDDTRVCPGHGDETSIGEEKMTNPFLT